MQSTSENQTWSPGPSLWDQIVEHIPRSEVPKIHATLGCSLVDTYAELHAEAVTWYKIWQDGQQVAAAASLSRSRSFLADPPVMKDLVRGEVKMLLESLQEKFLREGRHKEDVLSRYNVKTVNFALGRLKVSPEPKDEIRRYSVRPSAEGEIAALKDKINISDINQVVQHLQSLLTEECATLKTRVQHIQEMIKKQCSNQAEGVVNEPTLAELKELRGAIQKDFDLYPSLPLHVPEKKAMRPTFSLPTGPRISDHSTYAFPPLRRPHPPANPPHKNFCGLLKPIDALDGTPGTYLPHRSGSSVSRHRKIRLKSTASEPPPVAKPSLPADEESDFFWQLLSTPDSSPFFPTQHLQPG
ncbi:coiled-coil domain-containing protein 24-like isoform X1 [Stigmatopora argus]